MPSDQAVTFLLWFAAIASAALVLQVILYRITARYRERTEALHSAFAANTADQFSDEIQAIDQIVLIVEDLARVEPEREEQLELARLGLLKRRDHIARREPLLRAFSDGSISLAELNAMVKQLKAEDHDR